MLVENYEVVYPNDHEYDMFTECNDSILINKVQSQDMLIDCSSYQGQISFVSLQPMPCFVYSQI